ncbi:hypothetical protein GFS31_22980 [Leptolyngbya sp. BL0902]|nr:hypothetical protein GFS31_22980 [Leptolyngbya sp. BL0902]
MDTHGSRRPTRPFHINHAIGAHRIADIALQIRQSLDLSTIWQTTVDAVQQVLDCDRALLYQFAADKSGQVVVEAVADPQWSILGQTVHDVCFEASWLEPYDERQVRVIVDVATANLTPCHAEFLAGFQVRANLVVPVLCESRLWGLLMAHHCAAPRNWSSEEIASVQQLAVQVGIAIQQANLVAQLQAAKADLEAQVATRTAALEQANQQLAAEIADRKAITADLQQREGFLRQVLDSLFTFVGVLTPDGTLVEANQAPLDLAGLTREDVVGKPFAEAYWWAYSTVAQDRIRAAIAQANQGQAVRLDIEAQVRGGHFLTIDFSLNPLRDVTGRITHLIPSGVDITQRKQAEANLRASEARWQFALEGSGDGVWDWNTQTNTVFFSRQWKAMLGYGEDEVSNSLDEWSSRVHPDDLEQCYADLQRHFSGETPLYQNEHRVRCKDGSYKWILDRGKVIEWAESGEPLRVIGTHSDVSNRKQIELDLKATNEELDQFFSVALDLLCIADADGCFRRLNQQWQQTLGYSLAELEGARFLDYVHPEDLSATLEGLGHLANQQAVNQFTNRYRCQDGSYRWIEWHSVPVGNLIYAAARDITNRRQAELDLKQAKEQLDLVLQASSEGFSDWNVLTNEIYFSPQFKQMLGYAEHEFENSLAMWNSVIFEEDKEAAWKLVEDYNNGIVDNFSMVQRYHHKDGSIVHFLTNAIHLKDAEGQVVRMVGSYLDITPIITLQEALKTSEMQLESVLDSSLDGIMAFRSVRDDEGTIVDFEWLLSNPTACELVGRTEAYLVGQRLLEEMPGNREEGLFDGYVHTVETGEPYHREFHYSHDGIESWFETIAVKLGDGFAVTFRNVTTLKQSEQKLQQVNQQLEDRVADLDQRHAEMLILSEISDFLQACSTVEEACHTITNLVAALFPDCAGGIFITRASHNRLEMVSGWGDALPSKTDFEPHHCWGLRRGRMHYVGQDRLSLRCHHIPADAALETTLCIPMMAQGETLGLLHLSTATPGSLPEPKQQLARTLAEQVGMAIANLKLQETLRHQSIRDPLTGLYNRRYLEEMLTQEIVRAQRKQHALGVILLDIDHFKQFNDTFGHDAGDCVLQQVGTLLRENVRNSDIACRYGGEEMILILPEANLAETSDRAEMLRVAISQLCPHHHGQSLGTITASLGVAAFPHHGHTVEALIKIADEALYQAKTAGRNQVFSPA